jgi:hypothetical protein
VPILRGLRHPRKDWVAPAGYLDLSTEDSVFRNFFNEKFALLGILIIWHQKMNPTIAEPSRKLSATRVGNATTLHLILWPTNITGNKFILPLQKEIANALSIVLSTFPAGHQ